MLAEEVLKVSVKTLSAHEWPQSSETQVGMPFLVAI